MFSEAGALGWAGLRSRWPEPGEALSLVILASAMKRMAFYEAAFGYTGDAETLCPAGERGAELDGLEPR
jgi:hypothetical protein